MYAYLDRKPPGCVLSKSSSVFFDVSSNVVFCVYFNNIHIYIIIRIMYSAKSC